MNEIIWGEKNLIEQPKNCESKNGLEIKDTIKNIKSPFVEKEWKDIWIRKCPECQKEIIHKNKLSYRQSILRNKRCYSCSHFGRKTKEETKQKIREKMSGKNHPHFGKPGKNLGKTFTYEHCLKISLGIKGTKWNDDRRKKMIQLQNTNEYRKKCRDGAIKRMLRQRLDGNIEFRSYNPKACEYFDKLNEKRGWNLQHAKNGGETEILGYFLDAYDKNRNIVVEYDENHHYNSNWNLRDNDINRMNVIKKHLKCDFYRYNEVLNEIKKYE